jgi:hypothetical protein
METLTLTLSTGTHNYELARNVRDDLAELRSIAAVRGQRVEPLPDQANRHRLATGAAGEQRVKDVYSIVPGIVDRINVRSLFWRSPSDSLGSRAMAHFLHVF